MPILDSNAIAARHLALLAELDANARSIPLPEPWGGHVRLARHAPPSLEVADAASEWLFTFPFDAPRLLGLNNPASAELFERAVPGSIIATSLAGSSGERLAAGASAMDIARQAAIHALEVEAAARGKPAFADASSTWLDAGSFWIELTTARLTRALHRHLLPKSVVLAGSKAIPQDQETRWPRHELVNGARALGLFALALCTQNEWRWRDDFFLGHLGAAEEARLCGKDIAAALGSNPGSSARKPRQSL